MRDPGCRECAQQTSGNCGKHGPLFGPLGDQRLSQDAAVALAETQLLIEKLRLDVITALQAGVLVGEQYLRAQETRDACQAENTRLVMRNRELEALLERVRENCVCESLREWK